MWIVNVSCHILMCSCQTLVGDNCGSGSEEACSSVSDDALFLEKLKHMGKCKKTQTWSLTANSCNGLSSLPFWPLYYYLQQQGRSSLKLLDHSLRRPGERSPKSELCPNTSHILTCPALTVAAWSLHLRMFCSGGRLMFVFIDFS